MAENDNNLTAVDRRILERLLQYPQIDNIRKASSNVLYFSYLHNKRQVQKPFKEIVEHVASKNQNDESKMIYHGKDGLYYMLHPENIKNITKSYTDKGNAVIKNALNFAIQNKMDAYTVPHPERRMQSFGALVNFRKALSETRKGRDSLKAVWFDIETLGGQNKNGVDTIMGIYDYGFAQLDSKTKKIEKFSTLIGVNAGSEQSKLLSTISNKVAEGKELSKLEAVTYEYVSRLGASISSVDDIYKEVEGKGRYIVEKLTSSREFLSQKNLDHGIEVLREIGRRQSKGLTAEQIASGYNLGVQQFIDDIVSISDASLFGGHNVLGFDIQHISNFIHGNKHAQDYLRSTKLGQEASIKKIFDPNKTFDTLDVIRSLNQEQTNEMYRMLGMTREAGTTMGQAEQLYKAIIRRYGGDTHHNAMTDALQEMSILFGERNDKGDILKNGNFFETFLETFRNRVGANASEDQLASFVTKNYYGYGYNGNIGTSFNVDDYFDSVAGSNGTSNQKVKKLLTYSNKGSYYMKNQDGILGFKQMGTQVSDTEGNTVSHMINPNSSEIMVSKAYGDPYARSVATKGSFYETEIRVLNTSELTQEQLDILKEKGFNTEQEIMAIYSKEFNSSGTSFRANATSVVYMSAKDFQDKWVPNNTIAGTIDKEGNVALNEFGQQLEANRFVVNSNGKVITGKIGETFVNESERVVGENALRRVQDGSYDAFLKGRSIRKAVEEINSNSGMNLSVEDFQKEFVNYVNGKDSNFESYISNITTSNMTGFGEGEMNKASTWLNAFTISKNGTGGFNTGWADNAYHWAKHIEAGSRLDQIGEQWAKLMSSGKWKEHQSYFWKSVFKNVLELEQANALQFINNSMNEGNNISGKVASIIGVAPGRSKDASDNLFVGCEQFLARGRSGISGSGTSKGITFNMDMSGKAFMDALMETRKDIYGSHAIQETANREVALFDFVENIFQDINNNRSQLLRKAEDWKDVRKLQYAMNNIANWKDILSEIGPYSAGIIENGEDNPLDRIRSVVEHIGSQETLDEFKRSKNDYQKLKNFLVELIPDEEAITKSKDIIQNKLNEKLSSQRRLYEIFGFSEDEKGNLVRTNNGELSNVLSSDMDNDIKARKILELLGESIRIQNDAGNVLAGKDLAPQINLAYGALARNISSGDDKSMQGLFKFLGGNQTLDEAIKNTERSYGEKIEEQTKLLSNYLGGKDTAAAIYREELESRGFSSDKIDKLTEIYEQQVASVNEYSENIIKSISKNGGTFRADENGRAFVKFGTENEVEITSALAKLEQNGATMHYHIGDTSWISDLSVYTDGDGKWSLSTRLKSSQMKLFAGKDGETYMDRMLQKSQVTGDSTMGETFFAGLKMIAKDMREAGLSENGGLHELRLNASANFEALLKSKYHRDKVLGSLEATKNKNANVNKMIDWLKDKRDNGYDEIDFIDNGTKNLFSTLITDGYISNQLAFNGGKQLFNVGRGLKSTRAGRGNYSLISFHSGTDQWDKITEGRNFIDEKLTRFSEDQAVESFNKVANALKETGDDKKFNKVRKARNMVRHADEVAAEHTGLFHRFEVNRLEATTKDINDIVNNLETTNALNFIVNREINDVEKTSLMNLTKNRLAMRTNTYEGGGLLSGRFLDETGYLAGSREIIAGTKDLSKDKRWVNGLGREIENTVGKLDKDGNFSYGSGYMVGKDDQIVEVLSSYTGDLNNNKAKRAAVVRKMFRDKDTQAILTEQQVTKRVKDAAKRLEVDVSITENFMKLANQELESVIVADSAVNTGVIKVLDQAREKHVTQVNMENLNFMKRLGAGNKYNNIFDLLENPYTKKNGRIIKGARDIIQEKYGINILEDNLSFDLFHDIASGNLESALWKDIDQELVKDIRSSISKVQESFQKDAMEARYFMDRVLENVFGQRIDVITASTRDALKHGTAIAIEDTWKRLIGKGMSPDEAAGIMNEFFISEDGNAVANYVKDGNYIISGKSSLDMNKLEEIRKKHDLGDLLGFDENGKLVGATKVAFGDQTRLFQIVSENMGIVKDPANFDKKPTFGLREINALRNSILDKNSLQGSVSILSLDERKVFNELFGENLEKVGWNSRGTAQIWNEQALNTISKTAVFQKGETLFEDMSAEELYAAKGKASEWNNLSAEMKAKLTANQEKRRKMYKTLKEASYTEKLADGVSREVKFFDDNMPFTNEYLDLVYRRDRASHASQLQEAFNSGKNAYAGTKAYEEEMKSINYFLGGKNFKNIDEAAISLDKITRNTRGIGDIIESGHEIEGLIWPKDTVVDLASGDEKVAKLLGRNRYMFISGADVQKITPGSSEVSIPEYQKEANKIMGKVKSYTNALQIRQDSRYTKDSEEMKWASRVIGEFEREAGLSTFTANYKRALNNHWNNGKTGLLHDLVHREMEFGVRNKTQVYDIASLIPDNIKNGGGASEEIANLRYNGITLKEAYSNGKQINFAIASTKDIEKFGFDADYFAKEGKRLGLSADEARKQWLERAQTEGIAAIVNRSPSDYQHSSKAVQLYFSENIAQGTTMADSITAAMMKNDSDGDTIMAMMMGARTKKGDWISLDSYQYMKNTGAHHALASIDKETIDDLENLMNSHRQEMFYSMTVENRKFLDDAQGAYENFATMSFKTRNKAIQKYRQYQMDRGVNGIISSFQDSSLSEEARKQLGEKWDTAKMRMETMIRSMSESEAQTMFETMSENKIFASSMIKQAAGSGEGNAILRAWQNSSELGRLTMARHITSGLHEIRNNENKIIKPALLTLNAGGAAMEYYNKNVDAITEGIRSKDRIIQPLIENVLRNQQQGVGEIDTGFLVFDTLAKNYDVLKGISEKENIAINYIRESVKEGYLTTKKNGEIAIIEKSKLAEEFKANMDTYLKGGQQAEAAKEAMIQAIMKHGADVRERYGSAVKNESIEDLVRQGFSIMDKILHEMPKEARMSASAMRDFFVQPKISQILQSLQMNTGSLEFMAKRAQAAAMQSRDALDIVVANTYGLFSERISKSEENLGNFMDDSLKVRKVAFQAAKSGSEMASFAERLIISHLGGWSKVAMGLAGGIMAAGYVGGNPSAPSGTEAQRTSSRPQYNPQPLDYQSQLPPLADSNLYASRQGPKQGYIININAQQPNSMQNRYAADLIQQAVQNQWSNNQININTSINERQDAFNTSDIYDYLATAL